VDQTTQQRTKFAFVQAIPPLPCTARGACSGGKVKAVPQFHIEERLEPLPKYL
jgi:hypothetical protein